MPVATSWEYHCILIVNHFDTETSWTNCCYFTPQMLASITITSISNQNEYRIVLNIFSPSLLLWLVVSVSHFLWLSVNGQLSGVWGKGCFPNPQWPGWGSGSVCVNNGVTEVGHHSSSSSLPPLPLDLKRVSYPFNPWWLERIFGKSRSRAVLWIRNL